MTPNELNLLEILLDELIGEHTTYHEDLKKAFEKINDDINNIIQSTEQDAPQAPLWKFGPVKGKPRALTKLKEKIVQQALKKFPLDILKDLSRGS